MSLRNKIIAGAAVLTLAGAMSAAGLTIASATTLTCTNVAHAIVPPIGCGGAELAYTARGTLDLAVLGTGSTTGNYWNSPVGFLTENQSNVREDFTVFAENGDIHSGPGGLGSYVVMYTPDGNIPSFHGTRNHVTGMYANTTPDIATPFTPGTNVYCLSVANVNDGPKGALRWHVVLRNCNTNGTFEYGNNAAPDSTFNSVNWSHANHYQVWSPVSGPAGLLFINRSLSDDNPYGFNPSNTPYVLDDRAFGGSGTQALAFPENDGLNQQATILGCTDPITSLNTGYQLCP